MSLDESLYTYASKPHDESRFEYYGVSFTPDKDTPNEELRRGDEFALAQARKKLPGDANEWTLDYILVETAPQFTHTFVFKKPRRRP
ncbi:MAG: hypothetical protein NDI90_20570 [Nitrospira sp. BO4]|jgi:hypothetical protein|nr:hypothetical protein [Nitrospira sp. BO4]